LWVSVKISQSWAMRCIHMPVIETSRPAARSRKFRIFSDANVLPNEANRCLLSAELPVG
jgi:hypothetical protein